LVDAELFALAALRVDDLVAEGEQAGVRNE
jgi:hypothetical protein